MLKNKIRVFIAEDHIVVRQGLLLLLDNNEFAVVGEASDGETAVTEIRRLRPDVAVIDINMPKLDGIEVTKQLKKDSGLDVKVLILTIFEHEKYVIDAFQAGASGYIMKTASKEDLCTAIRQVGQGDTYLDPSLISGTLINIIKGRTEVQEILTEREKEVLTLVACGKTNRDISFSLDISDNTVKDHIASILEKLDCRNRTEAVAKAIRCSIIV